MDDLALRRRVDDPLDEPGERLVGAFFLQIKIVLVVSRLNARKGVLLGGLD